MRHISCIKFFFEICPWFELWVSKKIFRDEAQNVTLTLRVHGGVIVAHIWFIGVLTASSIDLTVFRKKAMSYMLRFLRYETFSKNFQTLSPPRIIFFSRGVNTRISLRWSGSDSFNTSFFKSYRIVTSCKKLLRSNHRTSHTGVIHANFENFREVCVPPPDQISNQV